MGPKLLFIFGIVVAHGALAAGWIANEMPGSRATLASTCVNTPAATPDYSPRYEIYAMNVRVEQSDEVQRP